MASLDLSAVTIPGVVRKATLDVATHARLVILPTNMRGVKGGGLTVSIYPVGTACGWVSPDVAQPTEDAVYAGTDCGIAPADSWTQVPWNQSFGDPASIALFSAAGAPVVYVAVAPARVPE